MYIQINWLLTKPSVQDPLFSTLKIHAYNWNAAGVQDKKFGGVYIVHYNIQHDTG